MELSNPLVYVVLGCGGVAITLLLWYLIKRPPLDFRAKIVLLLGLGVFPFFTAVASTIVGMEATTHREFCGSCHVMQAHFSNASAPSAQSLAARHSRNPFFGDRSCYVCHADYGMYGYALTKAGGLRHVYMYYLGGYDKMPLPKFLETIHLRKPYDNTNCRQCHSGTLQNWQAVPDHQSLRAQLETNRVSCASAGCHGFAHPFAKRSYALPAEARLPTTPAPGGPSGPMETAKNR